MLSSDILLANCICLALMYDNIILLGFNVIIAHVLMCIE